MNVGSVGRLETGEVGLEQFEGIVGVEYCAALGRYFLVACAVFELFESTDILLSDLVDGKLIDSAYSVIVYFFVVQHALIVFFSCKDYVFGVLLSCSSLYLDVGLETEGSVEGND